MESNVHVNREVAAVEKTELHIHININVGDVIGSSLIIGGTDNRANVTGAALPPELA